MSALVPTAQRLPANKTDGTMTISDLQSISKALSPKLFCLNNDAEVFTLMMLGQADGIHPITALRRYHIIDGKPSMKSDAMLACFLESGGRVKWIVRNDAQVKADFCTKDSDDKVTIDWTIERAKKAGVTGKKNWVSYPCQMLTARVISEGIRLVMPQIVTGIYTPEEVQDFDNNTQPPVDSTPAPATSTETWGNTQPPVDVTPAPVEPKPDHSAKFAEVQAWIHSQFVPATWQRNDFTTDFRNYRQDVITRAEGLPEKMILELRGEAFYTWLTCMIPTADAVELNEPGYWEGKIKESRLPAIRTNELLELLATNRKALADKAA
jgi:hypothetical protein